MKSIVSLIVIVNVYQMNLAFIRYFLAVADTGNFTVAAERCHVTQPTLSAGIGRLEEEMGAKLFDRGRRSGLSAAGQRLLPHARAMVEAWQAARAEQRSSRRPRLLRAAIGSTVPTAAAMQWLASVQRGAHLELEIAEGTADAVSQRWQRGRCDVALFATRAPIAADKAFVLRAACEAHADAERLFAAHGVRPRAVLRSADEERCVEAVRAGLGVSLMPRSLLRAGLTAAAIREVDLERRVVLAWRENADAELVATLRETALAHPWPGRGARDDDRSNFAR